SSRKHYVLAALRVHRAFHFGFEPRRSCSPERFASIKNAGRRMAEVCQSPDVLRVDVRTTGKKTALYGRRVRTMARMEPRHQSGLVSSRASKARWFASARAAFELHLQKRTGALAGRRFL